MPGLPVWDSKPTPIAATKLAGAPRGDVKLASMITAGLDQPSTWDEAATEFAAGKATPPALATPTPAPPAPKHVTHRARRRLACHCETPRGSGSSRDALPFAVALAVALVRRRR